MDEMLQLVEKTVVDQNTALGELGGCSFIVSSDRKLCVEVRSDALPVPPASPPAESATAAVTVGVLEAEDAEPVALIPNVGKCGVLYK